MILWCLQNLDKKNKLNRNELIYTESLKQKQDTLLSLENDLIVNKALYQKIIDQSNVYFCPCCKNNLNLVDGHLIKSSQSYDKTIESVDLDNLKITLENITNDINKLTKVISLEESKLAYIENISNEVRTISEMYEVNLEYEEIQKDLEYLYDYKNTQQVLEKKSKDISRKLLNEDFSASYTAFKNSIDKIIRDINSVKTVMNLKLIMMKIFKKNNL